jgi:hypothetical protein
LMAGLPGWFSLARVIFRCCATEYGQNQVILWPPPEDAKSS